MGEAFLGVRKGARLLVAGTLLFMLPAFAHAVGLGRLTVKSALNEPLNAEIPLTSVTSREVRTLESGLAPISVFRDLGIERPHHLTQIKFNVAKRLDGTYFLQLTTRSPYQEPFLHMVVQVEWAGGRLRREYTALIDPPYLSSARPSSIKAPRIQGPQSDYEPLPDPLADEVLKESSSPETSAAPKKPSEAFESLPAPLPEEPKIVNKQAAAKTEPVVESKASELTKSAEPEPLPAPIDEKDSAAKSIDQIEADAFGQGGLGAASTVPMEPAGSASLEPMPEPMVVGDGKPDAGPEMMTESEPFELLGPPHIPIIPVDSAAMNRRMPNMSAAMTDEYKVKRGDTLYEIAQRLRRDNSVSLNQVMMALYDANPRAFYDNNVNNLRAGKILTVPEVERVSNVPRTKADREFRAHYNAWQEHRLKLAQAKAPVQVAADSAPVAAPKPAAKQAPVVDKAAERKAQILAKREAEAKAKAEQAKAAEAKRQAELKAKQDAQKAKQLADANAKKAAEEKRLAEQKAQQVKAKPAAPKKEEPLKVSKTAKAEQTEELLRIVRASMLAAPAEQASTAETESQQAAKERQMLAQRMNTLEETLESKKLQNKEISDKVGKVKENIQSEKRLIEIENPSLAKGKTAPAETKPQPAAPAAKAPEQKKPLTVAQERRPAARKPVPRPQPKEASILDTVMEIVTSNQFMLMLVAGVSLLGVAILAIYMKRRRKTLADFEESILSADTTTDDISTDSQEAMGETGDTSFLSDFSQEGMGNIATDEVDPIAEADVYLAYGRDEQAEDILKDAMNRHPDRVELKQKLLEIYHQRNDVNAFETLAEELYASGGAGAVWSQVAELGSQLNPNNPMFQGDAPLPMGGGAAPSGGSEIDFGEMAPGETMLDDSMDMDDSLDFNIDVPATAATQVVSTPAVPAGDDMGLEMSDEFAMDMDFPSAETASAPEEDGASGEDFALDFNMVTADESADSDELVVDASTSDDSGLDFNMDFGDSGSSSGSEELDMSADSSSLDVGDDFGLSMEEESSDDNGLSALDLVKASGGGLPENDDGSLNFSLSSGSDDSGDEYDLSGMDDDSGLSFEDSGSDAGGMDFSLDADEEMDASDLAIEAEPVAEAVGSVDADVGTDESWDEAATKLDLAKAYIDMGDADGAKSILDEVMNEGNDDQKRQASELAAQIA